MDNLKTYCKNQECDKLECNRHPNHAIPHMVEGVQFAHLDGNPLFCQNPTWYGNQVEVGDDS